MQGCILKALYIEAYTDESNCCKVLEKFTNPIFVKNGFVCAFTVVANASLGLEFTEHTCYDIILISQDLACGISAEDFVHRFRSIGVLTPIILMSTNVSQEVDEIYSCLLQQPFSAESICRAVLAAIQSSSKRFRKKISSDDVMKSNLFL